MEKIKDMLLCALLSNLEDLVKSFYGATISIYLKTDIGLIQAYKTRNFTTNEIIVQKATWYRKAKIETQYIELESQYYIAFDCKVYDITEEDWNDINNAYDRGCKIKKQKYLDKQIKELEKLCKQ